MSKLSRLLNPRHLVVIGGKECERVMEQCDRLGFTGEIWPVHPKRDEMRGRKCFRSVEDLPQVPDAAYVAVNRERTVDVVAQLSKLGCRGAICYAAGFAEADAENAGSGDLQKRLVDAAGDMPIIGPNCYGFINALEKAALWPDQHGARVCDEGVAILTQSSNIAINLTMQKRGLPIAYVMTAGNQAQLGLSQLGQAMLEDERVTALGLHIEGLDDVKAFEALALRARELKKPIVAIKVGKSEQAKAAALTHTASLAGSDAAHDALFERLGIARVHSLEAFLETLKLFHGSGVLAGNDILSLSCSGGEASLMADAGEGKDLVFRPYRPDEAAALKAVLGDIVTVANPLDYNTFIWGDWPGMIRLFEAALAPGFDFSMLVIDFPRDDQCDPHDWDKSSDCFVAAVKQTGAKAAIVATMPECLPERVADYLMSIGVTPLCGIDHALEAVQASCQVGKAWQQEPPLPLLPPSGDPSASKLTTLDENQSKTALRAAGLVVPFGWIAKSEADIEAIFANLTPGGAKLAVKALGIDHKSDLGAVRLNIEGREAALAAFRDLQRHSNRILIEHMAAKPLAELIVGVTRDPVVGLMMTIGAGGVLTELLQDSATLLLPASEADIRNALAGLRIGRLLEGYRNSDAADVDALVANILCIAKYAAENVDRLEELDVNPLQVSQFGSVAVDALIVERNPS